MFLSWSWEKKQTRVPTTKSYKSLSGQYQVQDMCNLSLACELFGGGWLQTSDVYPNS